MDDCTADELRDALTPILSLMSKSEKSQARLQPGTWQHVMLGDNLRALRVASSLMDPQSGGGSEFSAEDLRDVLKALASMIDRVENTQTKFSVGTSQHTLQRNRLVALRIAEAVVTAELDTR